MRTIYKYPFNVTDVVTLDLPRGAAVLHVACQGDVPCLWALVDNDNPPERRVFLVCGTGQPVSRHLGPAQHVATFFHGPFVWHLFEPGRG